MSSHFFGPLGSMTEVVVSSGVTAETARGFSEFVSAGGVRSVQVGRAAPRSWTVGRVWQGPEWARILTAAAHGLLPQCWLYDVAAARENMLPAWQSAGAGAAVVADGLPLKALAVGHSVTVPLLAGRMYTVSVWSALAVGTSLLSYKLGAGAAVVVSAPPGAGSRCATGTLTPAADGLLVVTVTGAAVAGLRVHDGAPDGRFYAGHGTPCKVAVKDPAQTLQTVADQVRSDYQITLLEVGKPGTI